MEWHMIIFYNTGDPIIRESIRIFRHELSQRWLENISTGGLPDGCEVFSKAMPGEEIHYFFSPTASELARDILTMYNALPVSAPETLNGLRKVEM